MPKRYSSKEIEKALRSFGYYFFSQKGSHGKYKNEKGAIIILPMNKKIIPVGTFKSILKQLGISQEEFEKSL